MGINRFNYGGFASAHAEMSETIREMNATLTATSQILTQTLEDESKGAWAASKMNDWGPLSERISKRLQRMEELMNAAAAGDSNYQEFEQQNSGLKTSAE